MLHPGSVHRSPHGELWSAHELSHLAVSSIPGALVAQGARRALMGVYKIPGTVREFCANNYDPYGTGNLV